MQSRLCSLPWAAMTGLRNWCYKRNWLRTSQVPVPVICVGNISLGGSGKTPLVIQLAKDLAAGKLPPILSSVLASSRKPGILLRGYGRKSKGFVLVSRGADPLVDVYTSGDEARVLARACKGVPIAVCEDRVTGARELLKEGVELVLLDDGFQHRRLRRDLDLLVWDCRYDPARECLLPFGRLRESPLAAARAGAILFSRPRSLKELDARRRWFATQAETSTLAQWMIESRSSALQPAAGSCLRELHKGERYGLFCGLGNPHQFFRMQEDQLGESELQRAWADHHWYSSADLEWLRSQVKERGIKAWVTTAKDAVRLPVDHGLPLMIAGLEVSLVSLPSVSHLK